MKESGHIDRMNRRDFIGSAMIAALSIGLGAMTGSCKNEPPSKSGVADKTKEKKKNRHAGSMSIIDIHRHCLPTPSSSSEGLVRLILELRTHWRETGGYTVTTFDGISSIIYPELMDIDMQIRGQEEAGVTKSVLSFSMALETLVKALFFLPEDELTRRLNDATFQMVEKYPDKLEFMAIVNPFNQYCIDECERCVDQMNAKGISINTSWDGTFLDAPELDDFWEFAQQRDLAIFLHPPQVPLGHEVMNAYKLEEMVGRPFDTSITVARMIYAGVFDRYPNLKIVLPHMGAALPMIVGRLDFGYRLGYSGLPSDQAPVCARKPSEYFRTNLYVDTMGFAPHGIRHVIDLFGVDRVLFGTDYAAVPISPKEHVDMVKSLGLSPGEEDKILWKNADRLLKIS